MTTRRPSSKQSRENKDVKFSENLPEVALAAIASYRNQREVSDFINFILEALERNSSWLNNVVSKQANFRCILMIGAGPNRFQTQEVIYPSVNEEIKLEVELNDCEDRDKVALAACLKLSTADLESLLKYTKTRMNDNPTLRDDLMKGRGIGISFAVLRPITDVHYRVMERITFGSSITKCPAEPLSKRRRDEKTPAETLLRKSKH